uniref:Uncharacterized protein n=1 Tax=Anguilla anguilla TaxID=7936 RepID=A0A0E9RK11_ANGAN
MSSASCQVHIAVTSTLPLPQTCKFTCAWCHYQDFDAFGALTGLVLLPNAFLHLIFIFVTTLSPLIFFFLTSMSISPSLSLL